MGKIGQSLRPPVIIFLVVSTRSGFTISPNCIIKRQQGGYKSCRDINAVREGKREGVEGGKRGRVGREERKKKREHTDIREEKETGTKNNGTRDKHMRKRVLEEVTEGAGSDGTDGDVVLMAHTTGGG